MISSNSACPHCVLGRRAPGNDRSRRIPLLSLFTMTWLFWRKRHRRNKDASGCILPQELVDECMSYLDGYDSSNLRAAALVCRSWSLAAQGLLFKTLHLNTTRRYRRVQKVLRMSPHLVHYIQTLSLGGYDYQPKNSKAIKIEAFEKFCDISFTHVESVVFVDLKTSMTFRAAIALQRLFSLPTLRRMELDHSFMDPAAFLLMWDNCSPAIRHLQLHCYTFGNTLPPILPQSSPPVALTSLKLGKLSAVDAWLSNDLCPFHFSQLAALSITTPAVMGWSRMAPALGKIEVLDFDLSSDGSILDLSLFPNLQFLRISCYNYPHMMASPRGMLSTVSSSSPICQIIFSFYPVRGDLHNIFAPFDIQMVALPLPSLSVGLEMSEEAYTRVVPFFPQLQSKNMLCRTDYGWFERHVDRLG
ncbi:hypothetical protein K438DRAFT_1813573 [Mycena galopus ATCC 62051]|nr:hypothetical protein K438DRAFT_1813573 [Mycena galopus ATCC 62051]